MNPTRLGTFGIALFALIGSVAGGVELVRDGRPLADIVVAGDALSSVKTAAEDVQKHIERMSGARLEIVADPTNGVANHIFVGPSVYTAKLGITTADLKP